MHTLAKLGFIGLVILALTVSGSVAETALAPSNASLSTSGSLGLIDRPHSPLPTKVQYYCRRDCDWCRNDCYGRFRIYCYNAGCRSQFVLCMRGCWYNICRYC